MKEIAARVCRRLAWAGLELSVQEDMGPSGSPSMVRVVDAEKMEWKDVKFGEYAPVGFRLSMNAAQCLMDDLFNAGVRPTEAAGTAGSMAATQAHLADMRVIVADKLKVNLDKDKRSL